MTEESITVLDERVKRSIMSSVDPLKAAVIYLFNLKDYYDWVGIYIVSGKELVLGPFMGPPTQHTRILIEKGICGAAVREQRTINLPDVWADKRFIACSTTTRSEMVVPIWFEGKVVGEIDIDSNTPSAFSKDDEVLVRLVGELITAHVGAKSS
jgi:putative methionine-R-sulfoxide reductase with GAF domain